MDLCFSSRYISFLLIPVCEETLRSVADAEWSLLVFSGASFIQRTAGISVQQSRLPAGIQWSHVVRSTYYCGSGLDIGPHSAELGMQFAVWSYGWKVGGSGLDWTYLIVKIFMSFSIVVSQLVIRRSVDSLHQEKFQANLSSSSGQCYTGLGKTQSASLSSSPVLCFCPFSVLGARGRAPCWCFPGQQGV